MENDGQSQSFLKSNSTLGMMVAALYTDMIWHRARIVSTPNIVEGLSEKARFFILIQVLNVYSYNLYENLDEKYKFLISIAMPYINLKFV